MKKLFLVITMFCIASVAMFAQDTKWGVGFNVGYGTEVAKPFLGVKGQYNITEAFTVAASFNHYFSETVDLDEELGEYTGGMEGKLKCWELNADFHWNVVRTDLIKFYPLVGLTYLHAKGSVKEDGFSFSNSDGYFGANIGVGAQFDIATNWAIGVEAKYQIMDNSQFVPMATVMYKF